jgi:superfamily II DNA or RNA helicase
MFLLLDGMNAFNTTLLQLSTGTGKSLMFGLMSCYLNKFHNKKMAVVVPSEVLAAIQQRKYSPGASKIGDELFEVNSAVHYCTYRDLLTGKISTTTVLLVDEIDSLFFANKVELVDGRLISAILLLNKHKVIGMTATFRGDQG